METLALKYVPILPPVLISTHKRWLFRGRTKAVTTMHKTLLAQEHRLNGSLFVPPPPPFPPNSPSY